MARPLTSQVIDMTGSRFDYLVPQPQQCLSQQQSVQRSGRMKFLLSS